MLKKFKSSLRAKVRFLALRSLVLATVLGGGSPFAQDCQVNLGVVGPMTGGASQWGLAVKAGAEFEAEMANAAGGIEVAGRKCKVSVSSYDGQYTSAGGAAASNHFASKNIHVVIGPVGSPETAGFKPVAKRHGQINFSSSVSVDVIGPQWPLAFHQLPSPPTWGPILIKQAKNHFNFNTAVVLGPNDQGGTDSARALAKLYSDIGVKVTEEYYQRGTTNFAAIASRIMSIKPDLVEFGGMPPGDVTTLARQLMEVGFNGIFGRGGGAGVSDVILGAGGVDKIKGLFWLEYVPTDDPKIRQLRVDFERVMKAKPPESTLLYTSATATEQALRAISLAGTDQDADKIVAELRKMTPESRYRGKGAWRGKTLYGINQELAFPVAMGMVKDGKYDPMIRLDIPGE